MEDDHETLIDRGAPTRKRPTWCSILIVNLIFSGLTLLVYAVFLVWMYTNLSIRHGVADAYNGSCSKASSVAAYVRFVASIFAVLLFSVGTFAAQLLLSPTRPEIDMAHSRDRWLHVGVGGFRNMRWIHKRRMITAIVLWLTCVLMPFLHNAAIFTTLASSDNIVALVSEDFVHGSIFDGAVVKSSFLTKSEQYYNISKSARLDAESQNYDIVMSQIQNDLTDFVSLSPRECRSAYSSSRLPSTFSNVVLVSSTFPIPSSTFIDGDLRYPEMAVSSEYRKMLQADLFNTTGIISLFHDRCADTEFNFGNGDTWYFPVWDPYCTVTPYPVQYCLAQPFDAGCGVSLDVRVLTGIVICLLVEVACLASLAFSPAYHPLVTVGDAVASFLEHSDPATAKKHGLAIPSVHSPSSRFDAFGIVRSERDIVAWRRKWPTWRAAVDTETCSVCIHCLYLSFFAAVTAVLIVYNDGELFAYQPLTLQSPTSTHGLFSNLVSLGSVHIAISITYLFYNHLLSRMFAAVELNTYLKKRSPLRVTNPRPGCRPSYYLNLPPQFFVPLLITLAFLHFLTTHSLHVVSIDAYDIAGQYSHRRITFGTSTSAAILALVLGFVLLFALAIALERPLSSGMPVLGTCSMAISAACHADDNAHLGPIRYGRNSKTRKAGFHVDGSQDRGLSSG